MKIGIVGLGSIGRRHVRALAALGVSDVVALRTGKGAGGDVPDDLAFVKQEWNPDAFWRQPFDGVLIANPTSLHGSVIARAADIGFPTFVEKPLVGDMTELPVLSPEQTGRIIVGFCLRFHPLVKAMHAFINAGEPGSASTPMGRVMKARLYFGSYLPGWHPSIDYRREYMSRKDLGGGVLRTACHELDLVQYLFGSITSVSGVVERVSDLQIDVDDSVMLVCGTKSGATALVELDYLNPEPTRVGSVFGTGGRLDYTLSPPTARFIGLDRLAVEIHSDATYPLDEMYRSQMADFVTFAATGKTDACSFAEATDVMRTIAAAGQMVSTPVKG